MYDKRNLKCWLAISVFLVTIQCVTASGGNQASNPDPCDGEMIDGHLLNEDTYAILEFTAGLGAVEHTGYFSDDYSKVASRHPDANLGQPPYPPWPNRYYVGLATVPNPTPSLVRGTTYYWTVDEGDADGHTYPGDIWEFTILGFYAFDPSPPNEAVFVPTDVLLTWLPGYFAPDRSPQHDIYMGTDWDAVNDARYDILNPPPEFVATRFDPNFQCSGLELDTKFFWRIDEVHGRMPPPIGGGEYYTGDVWEFTTGAPQIFVDIGLRVYDRTSVITIACEQGAATSALRIVKNGVVYGIVLADPSDTNASGIRIGTSSGVKALRKL